MATLKDIDLLKVGHTIQLSGAVFSGEGKLYLVMLPEEGGKLENKSFVPDDGTGVLEVDTLDMDRDDWATFLRQTDLLEVEALVKGEDNKTGKAILRKSQRQIDQGVSWQVFHRDHYHCRYCGKDQIPLTVDHLVLWEDGGPSTLENLVTACRKCNKTRGNLAYSEWLEHPYYRKVSKNLPGSIRQANLDLAATLDTIPRTPHKRSR